jgi:hypothetical protein
MVHPVGNRLVQGAVKILTVSRGKRVDHPRPHTPNNLTLDRVIRSVLQCSPTLD